ncbi:membrane-spanning 4-domains subfamily A member 4D-like [Clupea harengus]|uniref:Membrane-spanning 4-domains subfamily A member 4D-like n=1 Tax=Clupea harengus TaxID=7950 RepID=A0A6P8GQI4_CLUHA|nr:membrane-spanning 4-domains subfamily A member 4D-like [Clupea harengus]XP_031441469.1 membrane-spanning 4-domains subfamily A member 4D-like [Clupea harengus]XP_031441470.1 membrane-spanning 4-domains subfamily A member 4D-like [Clupea harengus]
MGLESQNANRPPGDLKTQQVDTYLRLEPKTLGAIQVLIGVLTLCLSATLLQIKDLHFVVDIIILLLIALEIVLSGSFLIVTGLRPTLLWLKAMLVVHLVSLAFTTAALGLLSKNLPYRQTSYHCEHCRRLEIFTVLLIDGILGTLVLFLIVELVICIVVILFGLSVLAQGGIQLPGVSQRLTTPPVQVQPVMVAPAQMSHVTEVVTELQPERQPTPEPKLVPKPMHAAIRPEPVHVPSPPMETTEPQVVPIEPQVVPIEPQVVPIEPQVVPMEPQVVSMEPQVVPMEPQVEPL